MVNQEERVTILAQLDDQLTPGFPNIVNGLGAIDDAAQAASEALGELTSQDLSGSTRGLDDVEASIAKTAATAQQADEAIDELIDGLHGLSDAEIAATGALNQSIGAMTTGNLVAVESAASMTEASVATKALAAGGTLLEKVFKGITRAVLIHPFISLAVGAVTALLSLVNFNKILGRNVEALDSLADALEAAEKAEASYQAQKALAATPEEELGAIQSRIDLLRNLALALEVAAQAGTKLVEADPIRKLGASVPVSQAGEFGIQETAISIAQQSIATEIRITEAKLQQRTVEKELRDLRKQRLEEQGKEATALQNEARKRSEEAAADRREAKVNADERIKELEREAELIGKTADDVERISLMREIMTPLEELFGKGQLTGDELGKKAVEANNAISALQKARREGGGTALDTELEFVAALRKQNELFAESELEQRILLTIEERKNELAKEHKEISDTERAGIRSAITAGAIQTATEAELKFVDSLKEQNRLLTLGAQDREIESTIIARRNALLAQGLSLAQTENILLGEKAAIIKEIQQKQELEHPSTIAGGATQGLQQLSDSMGTVGDQSAVVTQSVVVDFLGGIVDSVGRAQQSFSAFARQFVVDTLLMISKALLLRATLISLEATGFFPGLSVAGAAATGKSGGLVQTFDHGGPVIGPPIEADVVDAKLMAGEYVHKKKAVKYYGASVMEAINRMLIPREVFRGVPVLSARSLGHPSFAGGGPVGSGDGAGRGVQRTAVVASEQAFDRLQRGGEAAMFKFFRDNRNSINQTLGR